MFLTHFTASVHFYGFLSLAVCLIAAFNLFEVVFLLVHERRLKAAEIKKGRLKRRIAAALLTQGESAEALPAPLAPADYEAYSEAFANIIESFKGEIAERAVQLTGELGIDAYYKSLYRNSKWYKRAGAIDTLSALKLKNSREFFFSVFKSETSDEVKYRILYGLSLVVRDRKDIYSVSRMLSGLPYLTAKYNEDIYFNMIAALRNSGSEGEFGVFLEQIQPDPGIRPKVKRDCLSACHEAGCGRAVVMEYYRAFQDEPEIIVACIKTLARIGDFAVLPEALRHKDWCVRLTALKYAHLGAPAILTDLKTLLHDANYHVRLNAALALSLFGAPGIKTLRSEAASSDKFAAEAARYALSGAGTAL